MKLDLIKKAKGYKIRMVTHDISSVTEGVFKDVYPDMRQALKKGYSLLEDWAKEQYASSIDDVRIFQPDIFTYQAVEITHICYEDPYTGEFIEDTDEYPIGYVVVEGIFD